MSTVNDAVRWSGSGTILNLFVITRTWPIELPNLGTPTAQPSQVFKYELDDEEATLAGLKLVEYDIHFKDTPLELATYLRSVLTSLAAAGALVAWFQFDGPFDLDDMLSSEYATQVFAIVDPAGAVSLALEDSELSSASWMRLVTGVRAALPSSEI